MCVYGECDKAQARGFTEFYFATSMDPFAGRSALPVMSGPRNVLRPITNADVPAVLELFSNPEVTRYWGHSVLQDTSDAESWVARTMEGFRDRSLLEWAIADSVDAPLIGTACFAEWNRTHRWAKIGFALRHDRWGQGIVSEILPVLLRFGFRELHFHRVEAEVDPRNHASIRGLERLGFRLEGWMRERHIADDGIQDELLYGLLASDVPTLAT